MFRTIAAANRYSNRRLGPWATVVLFELFVVLALASWAATWESGPKKWAIGALWVLVALNIPFIATRQPTALIGLSLFTWTRDKLTALMRAVGWVLLLLVAFWFFPTAVWPGGAFAIVMLAGTAMYFAPESKPTKGVPAKGAFGRGLCTAGIYACFASFLVFYASNRWVETSVMAPGMPRALTPALLTETGNRVELRFRAEIPQAMMATYARRDKDGKLPQTLVLPFVVEWDRDRLAKNWNGHYRVEGFAPTNRAAVVTTNDSRLWTGVLENFDGNGLSFELNVERAPLMRLFRHSVWQSRRMTSDRNLVFTD